jgi:hypothetical protein
MPIYTCLLDFQVYFFLSTKPSCVANPLAVLVRINEPRSTIVQFNKMLFLILIKVVRAGR